MTYYPMQPMAEKPRIRPKVEPKPSEFPDLQKKFDDVLRGQFKRLEPEDKMRFDFKSGLSGITSVLITGAGGKPGMPPPETGVMVVSYKTPEGKEGHKSLTITRDGRVLGLLPPEIRAKASEEAVLNEVLDKLDHIGFATFWHTIESAIFPKGPWPKEVPGEPKEKKEPTPEPTVDERRLAFLKNLPGARYGFVSKLQGGFTGYHGIVSKHGYILLDHPEIGNAIYILDDIEVNEPPPRSASKEEWNEFILAQPWAHRLERHRYETLKEGGAERVLHVGEWEQTAKELTEKRKKPKK